MSACSRGRQASLPLLRRAPTVCARCMFKQSIAPRSAAPAARRLYSAAAAAAPIELSDSSSRADVAAPHHGLQDVPRSDYSIKSGIILSRPPLLTRDLTTFENSFFFYQKRLSERMGGSFPRKFYFKPDTPAQQDWDIKLAERQKTMAKELGVFDAHGKDAWDDEVRSPIVGDDKGSVMAESFEKQVQASAKTEKATAIAATKGSEDKSAESASAETSDDELASHGKRINIAENESAIWKIRNRGTGEQDHLLADQARIRELLVRSAEMRVSEDGERLKFAEQTRIERPQPRQTEADEKNDVTRLDRKLDRTLYLIVKGRNGVWGFPASDVRTDEPVHETATRALEQAGGVNMNTWMVSRHPIAHTHSKPVVGEDGSSIQRKGSKVFYLKGRIMAGQVDLTDNTVGLTEYRWLTKDELATTLRPELFHQVRNALAAR